ncbi:hypothetical protein C8T65DRAFT_737080 [Cerioporus squamosus]|nr:hypothetical protein C8T65DRAFT_737080 [Cerioporus squamosus]
MAPPTQLKTLPSLRNIPQEVFSQVFALLETGEDKATLASCILVSKLWHDMALPYLLAKIVLRPQALQYLFTSLRRRSKRFLRLSIRSLTIRDEPASVSFPLTSSMLRYAVYILPKLRRLSLQNISLAIDPTDLFLLPPPCCIHLDTLELREVQPDRPDYTWPLTFLIRTLPQLSLGELTVVSLNDHLLESQFEMRCDSLKLQIPVRKLDIRNVQSEDTHGLARYYQRVSRCLIAGSLRSLSTSVTSNDDLGDLAAFLRHAKDITNLELELSHSHADACLVSQAVLTLESLSILRLHTSYNALSGEAEETFPIAPFFAQRAWRTLEELHLVMPWSNPRSRSSEDQDGREAEEEHEEVVEEQEPEWQQEQQEELEEKEEQQETEDADVYDRLLDLDRILSNRVRFPALRRMQVTLTVDSSFTSDDPYAESIAEHFSTAVFPEMCRAGLFDIRFAPIHDPHASPLHVK